MSEPNPKLIARLDGLAGQFDELEQQLIDPQVLADPDQVRVLSTKRAALAATCGKACGL